MTTNKDDLLNDWEYVLSQLSLLGRNSIDENSVNNIDAFIRQALTNDWRPKDISTAPKDGTWICLYYNGQVYKAQFDDSEEPHCWVDTAGEEFIDKHVEGWTPYIKPTPPTKE